MANKHIPAAFGSSGSEPFVVTKYTMAQRIVDMLHFLEFLALDNHLFTMLYHQPLSTNYTRAERLEEIQDVIERLKCVETRQIFSYLLGYVDGIGSVEFMAKMMQSAGLVFLGDGRDMKWKDEPK